MLNLAPSSCATTLAVTYSFSWTLSPASGTVALTSLTSQQQTSRDLVLQPNMLASGGTYTATCRVRDSAGSDVTASSTFTVGNSPLSAIIAGSSRQRTIDQSVTIDAQESSDPDAVGVTTGLTFTVTWSCVAVLSASSSSSLPSSVACNATTWLSSSTPLLLAVPANSLTAGYDYTFKVTLGAATPRATSASIVVTTLAAPTFPSPKLAIDGPLIANPALPLRLITLVSTTSSSPVSGLSYQWSETQRGLVLSGNVLDGPSSTAPNLVIAPGVLVPGKTYVFVVTVTDPATPTGVTGGSASANIPIYINAAPTSGSCDYSQLSSPYGYAPWTVSCGNWSDPEGLEPLRYSFSYEVAATSASVLSIASMPSTAQVLTPFGTAASMSVVLPPGNLVIYARIADKFDAVATFAFTAVIPPPAISGSVECFVADQSSGSLSQVSRSSSAMFLVSPSFSGCSVRQLVLKIQLVLYSC